MRHAPPNHNNGGRKMGNCREDIIKAARGVSSSVKFLPYEEREALVSYFAKAIESERERCAIIAESALWTDGDETYPVDYREEIAALIRAQ
jgi:hypothetical protein